MAYALTVAYLPKFPLPNISCVYGTLNKCLAIYKIAWLFHMEVLFELSNIGLAV